MHKGTLEIEYEAEPCDPSDPNSNDYFDINKISVSGQELSIIPVYQVRLRQALEDVWNHSTIK